MSRNYPSWDTVYIGGKAILVCGLIILIPIYLFATFAILQFFCLLFLLILVFSRLYSEYLVRNIHIIRCDEELRVFRHEWVSVELRLENRGLLPAFMLALTDSPWPLSIFRDNRILRSLARRSWTVMKWQGHCGERGVFTLGPATVQGSDPLGLFNFQLTARETSRIYVYPVYRSITIKPPGGIPLGNMLTSNPLYEDITRSRSLRPYQIGDEPRRINWKVSARTSQMGSSAHTQSGGLMINEYEATASYPLMVFLNLDRNDYPVKKQGMYMERAIEAAAALCLKASSERQELGIIFYTPYQESGISVIAPSAFTLVLILERLAAVDWTAAADAPQSSRKPLPERLQGGISNSAMTMLEQGKYLSYGTRFLYIGPDLGDEAYISLNTLKKHHLYLEYLIIDERAMAALVPGKSPRYQMKEQGLEII